MAGLDAPLAQRWRALWQRGGAGGDIDGVFARLSSLYAAPGRYYHTLAHVEQCLEELDGARHLARDPGAVEAAIWFHDCIYDPRRSDNEARSADFAAGAMASLGVAAERIAAVRQMILATRHAEAPAGPDAQLLVDVDLAILGQPEAQFDAYERAIRREYGHVPDADFRRGRAAVLKQFLGRRWIYGTDAFRRRY